VANYVCASVNCALLRMRRQRVLRVSESQWQCAPTLTVASVVECPRLATGLPVYIEASPGRISKTQAQNAGAAEARVKGARVVISKGMRSSDPPVVSTYLDPPALKVDMTSGYDMRRVGRLIIYYPHAICMRLTGMYES
jgi:hypothetical protein